MRQPTLPVIARRKRLSGCHLAGRALGPEPREAGAGIVSVEAIELVIALLANHYTKETGKSGIFLAKPARVVFGFGYSIR